MIFWRWGALDDGALAHRVDLDRFRIIGGVLVLLLEHYGFRDGWRQRGEERAGGVEGSREGDVATHSLYVIAGAVVDVLLLRTR